MSTVGTNAENVLQSPLPVIRKSCLIESVLKPQAAEFAVGPVCHNAETAWVIGRRHQRRAGVGLTGIVRGQEVITQTDTPTGEGLVNSL